MHSYLNYVAWLCIGVGAVFAFPAAAMPSRRPASPRRARHGDSQDRRASGRSEGWPDLRTCLTVMAIGASILADQASDNRTRVLTSVPIFAVVVWNVLSWLRSRRGRAPEAGPPGSGGSGDPRYGGRPADQGLYR